MSSKHTLAEPRFSRRDALALAFGAGASAVTPRLARSAPDAPAGPLPSRAIPHGDERIPIVGLGTAISFDVGEDAAKRAALKGVVEALVEGGGAVVDTAAAYGSVESVLGELIGSVLRPRVFLATKVLRPETAELRRSLDRLKADKVDLIQLHTVRDPDQRLAAMREWKDQGLCRHIGITTRFERDYEGAEAIIRREKPDFVQIDYSIGDRKAEARLLPMAADNGLAVLTALALWAQLSVSGRARQKFA